MSRILKTLWWYFVRCVIKSSCFLYTNALAYMVKSMFPKKVQYFMVNHPNGLLDPLVVAVTIQGFFIFGSSCDFKNPTIKKPRYAQLNACIENS